MNRSSSRQGPTASLTTAQRTQSCCCVYIARRHYIHPSCLETRAVFRETLYLCRVAFALFTRGELDQNTYAHISLLRQPSLTLSARRARDEMCVAGVEARDLTLCHL